MPHQCVRCNTFYDDGATELLTGCPCGGKLFFYIRKEKLEQARQAAEDVQLSTEEKEQMEKDVFELVGVDPEREEPVVLDIEAIRVLKPGKYELDLVNIFRGEPLIVKLEEGKYIIDVAESFRRFKKK
ncbi:MAG: Zn-ribbon containing protein [Candidatus Woesearchaeota archaeon]